MRKIIPLLVVLAGIAVLAACSSNEEKKQDTVQAEKPAKDTARAPVSMKVEAMTFEVKDSTGKSKGWGYDLYVNGKRTIHQDIIPAVQGNAAFVSEADAKKVGDFAAAKMMKTGEFPTIYLNELQELGILKK